MKRTGFARKVYQPAPVDPGRIVRSFTTAGSTTGPVPKEPADRSDKFKQLARDEECTVLRYNGYCRCDPATTVLAHTNTQADQKGTGYKGHDSAGFFAGAECHALIDQPAASEADRVIRDSLVSMAQQRTRARLRELANSSTIKPWRRLAAIEVLAMLEKRNA
jgi:hypothetical protein